MKTSHGDYGINEYYKNSPNSFYHEVTIKKQDESSKNHKCNYCEKSFKTPFDLKLHLNKVHEGNGLSKCEFCAMTSLSENIIIQHKEKFEPARKPS